MPPLSDKRRTELRNSTKEAAAAFLEDLNYLREVTERIQTSRGELRRLSGLLRRLLVEKDIVDIAAPRIGRVNLQAPDNKPFYDTQKQLRFLFFASARAKVFGVEIGAKAFMNAGQPNPLIPIEDQVRKATRLIQEHDIDKLIPLAVDNFLAQRVLCYFGQWVMRRDVIKYVAHVASGVHSGTAKSETDKLIIKIRSACSYEVRDGNVEVHVLPELGRDSARIKMPPDQDGPPLDFKAATLDPVLVEILATAQLITKSSDILQLEDAIEQELFADATPYRK